MTNIKSQFCHAVFLGVFGQCLRLLRSDQFSNQICSRLPSLRMDKRQWDTQGKRTPEHTDQTSLGEIYIYRGRHSMCLHWEWQIPLSFCFLTCLDIAKVMARLITLICPGGTGGHRACCRKDSSVGVTLSALQKSIVNWEQMVFSSYFFFLPTCLALNKN